MDKELTLLYSVGLATSSVGTGVILTVHDKSTGGNSIFMSRQSAENLIKLLSIALDASDDNNEAALKEKNG